LEIKIMSGPNEVVSKNILVTDKQTHFNFPLTTRPSHIVIDPTVDMLLEAKVKENN
jgi:hypothetical protein